jgi:hypothetical protein
VEAVDFKALEIFFSGVTVSRGPLPTTVQLPGPGHIDTNDESQLSKKVIILTMQQRPSQSDNGAIFLDLLAAAVQREESDLANLRRGQPCEPSSVQHMGELYLHSLLRKEAMRRPEGSDFDSPIVYWEYPYEGGGNCDICFVHYVGGLAIPYAAFEIKGPWDAIILPLDWRVAVRADIMKHSGKKLHGTTNLVERYSVIVVVGSVNKIDTWMQRLDPDLQNEWVVPVSRCRKEIPINTEHKAPALVLRAEVLKYGFRLPAVLQ